MKPGVKTNSNFDSQWKMGEQLFKGISDFLKSDSLMRKKRSDSTVHHGLTYTTPKPKSFLGFFGPLLKNILVGFSSITSTLLKHVDNDEVRENVAKLDNLANVAGKPNSSLLDILGTATQSYIPGFDLSQATDTSYLKETIKNVAQHTSDIKYAPKDMPARFRV